MDVHVRGGAIDRELRRRQLARRLVFHRARTRTVFRFTGLSSSQLETLRKRWRIPNKMRRRGPAPTAFAAFNLRERDEMAGLAVFWQVLTDAQIVPAPAPHMDALYLGECICAVFEAYTTCFPTSRLEIEHVLLLIDGLEQGDVVTFFSCPRCKAVMLVDPLKIRHGPCSQCQRTRDSAAVDLHSSGRTDWSSMRRRSDEPVQLELF